MSLKETPALDQQRLVQAWDRTLPTVLNDSDKAKVEADNADPQAVRVHIISAGHSGFTFDFKCTYVDSREIKVELVDVEQDNRTIDERGEKLQQLIEDYVRHLHECAQALHAQTHA